MNKSPVRSFEDLMVLQKGIELVKKVYLLTLQALCKGILASGISFVERRFLFRLI